MAEQAPAAADSLSDPPISPSSSDHEQSDQRSLSRDVSFSKLNAKAPEFVPRSSGSSSRAELAQPRMLAPAQPVVRVYPTHAGGSFHHPRHVAVHTPHVYGGVAVPYHHAPQHLYGGVVGGYADQQGVVGSGSTKAESDHGGKKGESSDEIAQKLINQVEYYFSDLNLATTDHLMRQMNKDPEGYVAMSVVASFKKIKALISSNSQLADILRKSTKLVVSEDGKKIKRQNPLSEADMEELRCRIVLAENLPEDHSHQNLMKLFSAVGSVKMIRTCQPQNTGSGGQSSGSRAAKSDGMVFSNKLHAFVEYESAELAEKAVEELNDRGNWRNGLKVRLLIRCTAKSAHARVKKSGNEGEPIGKEEDVIAADEQRLKENHSEDLLQQSDIRSNETAVEEHASDKEGGQRKGRNRGRGKGRGRPQYHLNSRGNHSGATSLNINRGSILGTSPTNVNHRSDIHGSPVGTSALATTANADHPAAAKQSYVPRMPDGTRGFSMGRGKPVIVNSG